MSKTAHRDSAVALAFAGATFRPVVRGATLGLTFFRHKGDSVESERDNASSSGGRAGVVSV